VEVAVALWLFKEEPDHYSFADLARDGRAVWDGVTNALAVQHLRKVRPGDRVFFYHTGKEKAVVGEMRVVSEPRAAGDGKAVAVEVEPVGALARPVSLARIKDDPRLAEWELVRLPRLSVMPVSAAQWKVVQELSRSEG
jgi:predicted RNA-binding protein with PUA-like domain